jgi:hypothetical protein
MTAIQFDATLRRPGRSLRSDADRARDALQYLDPGVEREHGGRGMMALSFLLARLVRWLGRLRRAR